MSKILFIFNDIKIIAIKKISLLYFLYICTLIFMMKHTGKNMQYIPQPLDTSKVTLPVCLKEISEELAKNTHEIWAQQRFSEGWIYGSERNDELKKHPCLVPYEELPENEKEYDRNTAMDTIRFILCRGYEIVRK